MAKQVIAYQAHDGRLHLSREDAEFSEFSSTLQEDISDFLKQRGTDDADTFTFTRLLREWELWKQGGYKGWQSGLLPPSHGGMESLAGRRRQQAASASSITPSTPSTQLPLPLMEQASATAKRRPARRNSLLRVAVFGLKVEHHAIINAAFGDAFRLTLHDETHPPKFSTLKACHKVFVVLESVNFQEMIKMRNKGIPASSVYNVEDLDTRLTDLYVNTEEQKHP